MSLQPVQAILPLGQFDGLDAQYTATLGGEVGTFTYVSTAAGTDEAAEDVFDGYVAQANTRPAVTITLVNGARPLFLVDDGTTGYGTLFGEVVGALVGKVATGGAALGPHTATGSGKLTVWNYPGLYSVTLDAVDTTVNSGLVPTNPALAGGDALYATAAGLLTPNVAAAFEAVVVGRFIEFQQSQSLVTSTTAIVSALNSPPGMAAQGANFVTALINFNPEF